MSRQLAAENGRLRQRLHDAEARIRLLAGAVLAGDPNAHGLAELLVRGTLTSDGESLRPPSDPHSGEPAARSTPSTEVSQPWPT